MSYVINRSFSFNVSLCCMAKKYERKEEMYKQIRYNGIFQ